MGGTVRTQAAMRQGGTSAVGQAATRQGGTGRSSADLVRTNGAQLGEQPATANGQTITGGNVGGDATAATAQDAQQEVEGTGDPAMPAPVDCQWFTEAELRERDPRLQEWTAADEKLLGVYGDTIHHNDGSHLTGNIEGYNDAKWQRLYLRVISGKLPLYDLPNGRWAKVFLTIQTQLLKDARERRCNSEKPLIFAACILRKVKDCKFASEIKPLIWARLALWKQGKICALVKCVEEGIMESGWGADANAKFSLDSASARYDATVKSGNIRSAVRTLTDGDMGGLYKPNDKCSKSGERVIDVLRSKYPKLRIPDEEDFDHYPNAEEDLECFPVICSEDNVATAASGLKGAAGPTGVTGQALKSWLLRYGVQSDNLRIELSLWVEMLSNTSPDYACYRAMNSGRCLAADKLPGVRGLACGEIWMRLISQCNLDKTKGVATVECENVQLCAGLKAGIEGNLHAVRAVWPESAGWERDDGSEDDESLFLDEEDVDITLMPPPNLPFSPEIGGTDVDPGADHDQSHSRYESNTGFGAGLFDAKNAFGELNRYQLLHTIAHRWAKGSRFAMNRYRHYTMVWVRDEPGKPPILLLCKEGIPQGCTLSMFSFGVGTMPLCEKMRQAVPEALQPWYADDAGAAGKARAGARCLEYLVEHGPKYGYYSEVEKSWYVCKKEDEAIARREFAARKLKIKFTRGQKYLGGFIGSAETKAKWIEEKVEKWAAGVSTLSKVAVKYPQTAYAGFCFSLQAQWQYLQRVVAETEIFFTPVEEAIRREFLPALLDIPAGEISAEFRELLGQGVKQAGLGIRNPVDNASHVHAASRDACSYLTETLMSGEFFDYAHHCKTVRLACSEAREKRIEREVDYMDDLAKDKPAVKRRLDRSRASGCWLSVEPSRLNGNDLSAEEMRDNLRLRYNLAPVDMPANCDGCGKKMTVEHALQCKVGGLVHMRHDDVADEFRHLCGCALSFGKVEREPRIFSSVTTQSTSAAPPAVPPTPPNTTTTPQNGQQQGQQPVEAPVRPGERGDASCHGFWKRGREAIFDVRITDTECRSNRNRCYTKVLASQEKEKKDKYLASCHEMRKDFTPLVYSVDGIAGREARAAEKRLAQYLSKKWRRTYSEMVFYVKVRMALSVVRANSLLIRGSRVRQKPRRPLISDRASMMDWSRRTEW